MFVNTFALCCSLKCGSWAHIPSARVARQAAKWGISSGSLMSCLHSWRNCLNSDSGIIVILSKNSASKLSNSSSVNVIFFLSSSLCSLISSMVWSGVINSKKVSNKIFRKRGSADPSCKSISSRFWKRWRRRKF